MKVKEYTRNNTTVVWKPDVCIHSERCFHGLPKVFNPNQRPWIDMDGADEQEIIEQVSKCPSGALSIKGQFDSESIAEQTKIEVTKNGPLLVHGPVKITTPDGTEHVGEKSTSLCRCGASSNKPFCDGSHKKISFED